MQTKYDDVIYALRIYHDIPRLIAEEWATIRNCEEQRDKVGETAAQLQEVVVENGGKHGDKTARLASEDRDTLFRQEIDSRLSHIDELRRIREWIRRGLACIDQRDRDALDLAYIGPQDAAQRLVWQGKGWKEVATLVGRSESYVRHKAYEAMDKIRNMKEEG